MTQHKVVVLGTGSIGYRHLEVLKGLGVPALAVSVRESRRAELTKQGFVCVVSLGEARDMGATAAVIATDTQRHVTDTRAALDAGLHVLLEKPMASAAADAAPLMLLAQERALGLFVGCPLRFDPGLLAFREQLSQIGNVHAVDIQCRSYLPGWRPQRDYRQSYSARADEGGVLRDLIHEVDYALWLFGKPAAVFGRLENLNRLGIASEELAQGNWNSPGGAQISVGLDYLTRHASRFIRACGEHGEIHYDFIERKLDLSTKETREMTFSRTPNDIYIQQMTEFLKVASGEDPTSIATAQDGISALAVCDAWRKSAASNKTESIQL